MTQDDDRHGLAEVLDHVPTDIFSTGAPSIYRNKRYSRANIRWMKRLVAVWLAIWNTYTCLLHCTVVFRPIVRVTRNIEKKVFFYIRLKSKENLSAISGEKIPKIVNNRSKYYSNGSRVNRVDK